MQLPPELLSSQAVALGYYWAPQAGAFPIQLRAFRNYLQAKFGTLAALNANWGHQDFGVYATVEEPGRIARGDKLEIL